MKLVARASQKLRRAPPCIIDVRSTAAPNLDNYQPIWVGTGASRGSHFELVTPVDHYSIPEYDIDRAGDVFRMEYDVLKSFCR